MKVIHILCGKANPQTTMNGVNVVVDRYANMLFERGYDVEVWGIANNPYTNLPSLKYPVRFFQQYHAWLCRLDRKLIECLKKIDADTTIFHFHGGFLREFPKIVRMLSDPNYLIMPHGIYSTNCLNRRLWWKRLYFHTIEREFVRKSRGLLLLHEKELDGRLVMCLKGIPQYIIPNGADPRLVDKETKGGTTANDGVIVWGYCGRIDNVHKAVNKMVRCFLRFSGQRTGERQVLSIIGDGPDLNTIRSDYAQEINSGKVQIHGALFGGDKFKELRKMHYFVHLSNWEGLPLACLDAMALGIPVLVTAGTNLHEDVASYRAGVETLPDEDATVKSMHRLADMDRTELVNGCKQLIAEKYNWQRSCSLLIEVYQNALRGDGDAQDLSSIMADGDVGECKV